jgi:hypothetical protein
MFRFFWIFPALGLWQTTQFGQVWYGFSFGFFGHLKLSQPVSKKINMFKILVVKINYFLELKMSKNHSSMAWWPLKSSNLVFLVASISISWFRKFRKVLSTYFWLSNNYQISYSEECSAMWVGCSMSNATVFIAKFSFWQIFYHPFSNCH